MCETAGLPIFKHAFADLGDHDDRDGAGARDDALTTARTPAVPDIPHARPAREKVEFVDGAIAVPTGPGLGIELDREALAFYENIYEQYGEFEGYGPITPESPLPPDLHVPRPLMQTFDPTTSSTPTATSTADRDGRRRASDSTVITADCFTGRYDDPANFTRRDRRLGRGEPQRRHRVR